jgi:hypothetical protein
MFCNGNLCAAAAAGTSEVSQTEERHIAHSFLKVFQLLSCLFYSISTSAERPAEEHLVAEVTDLYGSYSLAKPM